MNSEQKVRIVLVGDSHVGKTSILTAFADNNCPSQHLPTIGVDFRFRRIQIDGQSVKLQIWDTAGQERFNAITSSYYRDSDIVCLVYDISQRTSFQNLYTWFSSARSMLGAQADSVLFLVIGNKTDKRDREVSAEEAAEFAAKLSAGFFEVSAKTRANLNEIFTFMAGSVIKKRGPMQETEPKISRILSIHNEAPTQNRRWFCALI